jgi:hypothetical protein
LHQHGLLGLAQSIDHGGGASAIRREINDGLGRVCRVCRGEKRKGENQSNETHGRENDVSVIRRASTMRRINN